MGSNPTDPTMNTRCQSHPIGLEFRLGNNIGTTCDFACRKNESNSEHFRYSLCDSLLAFVHAPYGRLDHNIRYEASFPLETYSRQGFR